jgi:3,4-dihydroxyphenylacetate 2,3-dioxygenase
MSNGPFLVDESARLSAISDYSGPPAGSRHGATGHAALAHALVAAGERAGVRIGPARRGADSGVMVPVHFLSPDRRVPVVPLSVAPQGASAHRTWGRTLRETLEARPERIAFVVGGVLSSNGHAWNLRREVPGSLAFDAWALERLQAGEWDALARPEKRWLKDAQPEARLRHLELLRGMLGADVPGVVRAYEAAPGMGAALVEFALEPTHAVPRETTA